MPLYEYECEACGHEFERIRKFSDPPVTECPVCGGVVHKLVSSPAIQFKGSGFYITDYPKKSGESGDKGDKGDKADSSEKAEKTGKSDTSEAGGSKSDTKAETSEKPQKTDKTEQKASPKPEK